ncbi:MAG: AAA family ATPase [Dehalococcoidia bacterium]|nr:AAA family ATPase [Dehalococcoidia bacterium]
MKLAISGKGGVGKTLLSALLAQAFARTSYMVTAIDADPDANLGLTLGFPNHSKIVPIAEMTEFIQERTETRPDEANPYFRMSPHVDDIPIRYAERHNGVRLLVMGRPRPGGAGCYCPENALLAALVAHLLLSPKEVIIMDMAAGIEHLNRGTARAVDRLLIIVEPGQASMETAQRIITLSTDLGLKDIEFIGNKIRSSAEEDFIRTTFPGYNVLGFVPYDESLVRAELVGASKLDACFAMRSATEEILNKLLATKKQDPSDD